MDVHNPFCDSEPYLPAASEDRQAQFLSFFLASEKEIFRYINTLVPYAHDAQDVLQQTALALWRKFDTYDANQPFTPWACRFALLEVKVFLRRNQKWHGLLQGDLAEVLLQRREALGPDLDRRFVHLAGCIDKLPQNQREIIRGYYYEQQSVDRLAAILGRTIEAVYKSLQRIRQALLDCVTVSLQREET